LSGRQRTCDPLAAAVRVAEILHNSLDLNDRISRLVLRLTYGVSGAVVDLAREVAADLLRGDYARLEKAGLVDPALIDAVNDDAILACVDGSRDKLGIVREASRRVARRRAQLAQATRPVLDTYVP
jgi:helicase